MRPIKELFGLGNNIGIIKNRTVGGFDRGTTIMPKDTLKEVNLPEFALSKWQKLIQNAFETKKSMIILASPASGKTNPVMRGFARLLINSFGQSARENPKGKSFPRMLYVTPRTQLATQMHDDFISEILLPVFFEIAKIDLKIAKLTPKQQQIILNDIKDNWLGIVSGPGGNTRAVNSKTFIKKPVVVATYNHASRIIEESGDFYQFVLIDELQEYFPNPGKPIEVSPNIIENLITLVDHGMQKRNVLVLATGSMHINSLNEFRKFLEAKYNKRVFLRSATQTNRSKLSLIPFSEMRNSSELSQLIKKLASAGMNGNLIITFAKKEKPIDRLSILSTAREIIKLLPVMNKNILITATKRKTVTAGEFIKQVNSVPVDKKQIDGSPESLLFFDINKVLEKRDETFQSGTSIAKEDPNNLLFQSVLRGVGFIVGGMEDAHKRTVQSLFRSGVLHTVIASDAVGVGANVLAKRLFLPDLHKFESGVFGPVNISNLIQLINRAGRDVGRIPFAAVYLQPKDIDLAKEILGKSPVIASGEVDIDIVLDRFENLGDKTTSSQKIKNLFKQVFLRVN